MMTECLLSAPALGLTVLTVNCRSTAVFIYSGVRPTIVIFSDQFCPEKPSEVLFPPKKPPRLILKDLFYDQNKH